MRAILQRAVKFGFAGALSTGVAYVTLILMLRVMHYLPAAALSWLASAGVGFVVNRRFTFGIVGSEGRARDLSLFLAGSGLQLALAMAGYAVLLGRMHLDPTIAFAANLVFTTLFSFAFMNLVTFRR